MAKFDITAVFKISGLSDIKKAFGEIGDAAGSVKKNFGEFTGAIGESIKRLTQFGLVAGAAGAAVFELTKRNAEAAEQLENLATKTGATTTELQELLLIAQGKGVDQGAVGSALTKVTKNLRDLKDPTSAAGKELQKLDAGLALSIRGATNGAEAFDIIRAHLVGMTDATKAEEIAVLGFGRAGAELLPVLQLSSVEFEEASRQLKNFGAILSPVQVQILSTADDAFDALSLSISATGKQLSVVFAPALTAAANALTGFVIQNQQKIIQLASVITTQLVTVVKDLFTLMSEGPEAQGVSERARQIYEGFIKIKDAVTTAFGIAVTAANAFFTALDPIAKILGAGDGQTLGIALAILQLTGLLKVMTTGITLAFSTLNLAFTSLVEIPAILTGVATAFSGFGAAIVGVAETMYLRFLFSMDGIAAAATKIGPALALLTNAFRVLWVAITGPVGLVVAAVLAVGAAIYYVIDATIGWDKALELIGDFFKALGPLAISVLKSIGTALGEVILKIIEWLSKIGDFILSNIAPAVISAFKTVGGEIVSFFGSVLEQANQLSGGILGNIIAALSAVFSGVVSTLQNIFSQISSIVNNIFDFVLTAAKNVFTSILDALSDIINDIIARIVASIVLVFEKVSDAIAGVIGQITGLIGNVISSLASFGTSSGGVTVTDRGTLAAPPRLAGGGPVRGPGTGRSDSVPLWGSHGEYMIRASSVQKYGIGFLHAVNQGLFPMLRGFADGGIIGALDSMAGAVFNADGFSSGGLVPALAKSVSTGRPLNLHLGNGAVIKTHTAENTAKKLERDLRNRDLSKAQNLPRWYK